MSDIVEKKTMPPPYIPNELVDIIADAVEDPEDLCEFRSVSKAFDVAARGPLARQIAKAATVYPTYASMEAVLVAIQLPGVARHVKNITLVAESLREHEYGYAWGWEDLQIWAGLEFTNSDIRTIDDINDAHADEIFTNGDFTTSGQYRLMLSTLLQCLPNLATITVRKLAAGEQIPGWAGAKLFKKLSFHHETFDTRRIFYGDWQYDTKHHRITHYTDEFGDIVSEPDAGPQASFHDDLKAAMSASATKAQIVWHPAI